MELSQETTQAADRSLHDELLTAICDPGQFPTAGNMKGDRTLGEWQRDAVMTLLVERGHYLPGAPPAATILNDAKSFAERLTLSNLALRILNMLAWSTIHTPESEPARRWLDDYLEGKGHGPVGQAMKWPAQLPGMCALLRDWGFMPTPTPIPYVARAVPTLTVQ